MKKFYIGTFSPPHVSIISRFVVFQNQNLVKIFYKLTFRSVPKNNFETLSVSTQKCPQCSLLTQYSFQSQEKQTYKIMNLEMYFLWNATGYPVIGA